jgi:hypothetical protein
MQQTHFFNERVKGREWCFQKYSVKQACRAGWRVNIMPHAIPSDYAKQEEFRWNIVRERKNYLFLFHINFLSVVLFAFLLFTFSSFILLWHLPL